MEQSQLYNAANYSYGAQDAPNNTMTFAKGRDLHLSLGKPVERALARRAVLDQLRGQPGRPGVHRELHRADRHHDE